MPPVGFEPTISEGGRPKTYALDRAATGTGFRIDRLQMQVRCCVTYHLTFTLCKGKAVPLQALMGPEGSGKFRFLDFVTTAQDDDRLSALRTGRLYPREILLVLISVRG